MQNLSNWCHSQGPPSMSDLCNKSNRNSEGNWRHVSACSNITRKFPLPRLLYLKQQTGAMNCYSIRLTRFICIWLLPKIQPLVSQFFKTMRRLDMLWRISTSRTPCSSVRGEQCLSSVEPSVLTSSGIIFLKKSLFFVKLIVAEEQNIFKNPHIFNSTIIFPEMLPRKPIVISIANI